MLHNSTGNKSVYMLCNALQVEVTDVAAGKMWYFEADCWLDAAAAGPGSSGRAERLLTAGSSNPLADRKMYQVKKKSAAVYTVTRVTLHMVLGR
jgi:hypothetical protein